jgi:hypothetical protein
VPTITQAIRTTAVPWISCCCPGHSTFFSSATDSLMKFRVPEKRPLGRGSAGGLRRRRRRGAHLALDGPRLGAVALALLLGPASAALGARLLRHR